MNVTDSPDVPRLPDAPAATPSPGAATTPDVPAADAAAEVTEEKAKSEVKEYGGRRDGTDPTRFGDWEKNGRCIDF